MTNTHKHSRRLTTRREELTRHTQILFREPTKPRAPARTDDPRRHRPRREIEPRPDSTTRPTETADRPTRERTYLELSVDERARGRRCSRVRGSAPATTAAEAAAGRLGRRTGVGRDQRWPSPPPGPCEASTAANNGSVHPGPSSPCYRSVGGRFSAFRGTRQHRLEAFAKRISNTTRSFSLNFPLAVIID